MNKFILIISIALLSCSPHSKLNEALEISGKNRVELEKVLTHYSKNKADSLKLRAAKFLIENMPGHHTLTGEYLDQHIHQFDSINPNPPLYMKSYFYSFPFRYPQIVNSLQKKYDIETITSEFLIKNIDYKFELLNTIPWGKYISFDVFCDFLLPYRIDIEPIIDIKQENLIELKSKLSSVIENYKTCNINFETLTFIGESVFNSNHKNTLNIKLPNREIYNIYECGAYAQILTEQNRLMGIPIMIDFVPHWGNADGRHSWCAFSDIPDKNMYINYVNRSKIAKVFRRTYSHNKSPKVDKNLIPYTFTPFIKDVTAHYIQTANITISYKKCVKKNIKNVYLAVFNEFEWQPIAWSEIDKNGNAYFKDLGKDIVYLPIYYEGEVEVIADYPFILKQDGAIEKLSPNDNKIKLHLERKFPQEAYKLKWNENIIGAVIEASNDAEFLNPDTLNRIQEATPNGIYQIKVNIPKKYRYIRIVQKRENGSMFLSELSFNDHLGDQVNSKFDFSFTVDKNMSYHDTKQDQLKSILSDDNYENYAVITNCIRIDFGKPTDISKITIGLRSDENYIYPNNTYELLYHDNNGWVSMGIKKAVDYFIEFDNAPSNAIYLLRNLTEGKEERIFTYENNRMKFW